MYLKSDSSGCILFGVLAEMDWGTLFKSFYEEARVKVLCRDPTKIPTERMMEMKQKLYKLFFEVELIEKQDEGKGNDEGKGDDPYNDDEADDLDELY